MANADPTKYFDLAGNPELTFVVDTNARIQIGTLRQIQILFNRAMRSQAQGDGIRIRYGELLSPVMKVGSSKFGIDLYRPNWKFQDLAAFQSLTRNATKPWVAQTNTATTDPRWTLPAVITYQKLNAPTAPERVVSAPFILAEVESTRQFITIY